MTDLSADIGSDEPFDLPFTDVINDQTDSIYNGSINDNSDSFDNEFTISNETMRLLFLAIATITILICLTICISVCICVCLNRRRNLKRQEKKDHRLLPEQSEKMSGNKLTTTHLLSKNFSSNGKQQSDKKNFSSYNQNSSSNIITGKTSGKTFYYDNLDDIPFIDESRPTSYIDITRV